MRALRTAPVVGFTLALFLGASVNAQTPVYDVEQLQPMQYVTGSIVLDRPESAGVFSVSGPVYQHRDVPESGSALTMNDPRMAGSVESTWNWDIHASGKLPVPAWGTMRIDVPPIGSVVLGGDDGTTVEVGLGEGAWVGDFTGIRSADGEPFRVRAFLFGEGAYEGLCAMLDIEADDRAWLAEGIIHRVPMAG